VALRALTLYGAQRPEEIMASRSKRRVKQRSKAHQKGVKKARKRRKGAHPKVGYGAKKRRAKKTRKAAKKK
jgi:hypothetical protein